MKDGILVVCDKRESAEFSCRSARNEGDRSVVSPSEINPPNVQAGGWN